MIVILLGAPGAGKGTQADFLKLNKGFIKISTGDLFRREIAAGTDLGKRVEDVVNKGSYVSDEILQELIKKVLAENLNLDVVLDGFPRTLPQATWLSQVADISAVIHIDTARLELINRMKARLSCSSCGAVYHVISKPSKVDGVCDICGGHLQVREDATEERILHRLDVYEKQTLPVLDFYKKSKTYFRVDGNLGEKAVSKQIEGLLLELAKGT